MRRRFITFAASVAVTVILAGCATPVAVPGAEETLTSTATPTPAVDLTAMPTNRFGLDCESLLGDEAITELYGQSLEPKLSSHFEDSWTEALIADGALVCRWGDGPYLDGRAQSIEIVASSREGASLDLLASEVGTGPGATQTRVSGVGDAAWVNCSYAEAASCIWSVEVDDLWVSLSLFLIPDAEVDAVLGDYGPSSPTPRAGSTSEGLVSSVVSVIADATLTPVPSARGDLASCDAIVDWLAVAAALSLPLQFVQDSEERTFGRYNVADAVVEQLGAAAGERQSVRRCSAEFDDVPNGANPTWVSLVAVPGGEWLEPSGLWPAWEQEDCHSWEGGPVCELSTQTDPAAVTLRVGGESHVGVPSLVMDSFVG